MTKEFERDLLEIKDKNTKANIISHKDVAIPQERLDYLKAKGLITMTPLFRNCSQLISRREAHMKKKC